MVSTQQNVGPLVRLSTSIINYIHWKFDFYIHSNIKYSFTGIIVKVIFRYILSFQQIILLLNMKLPM